VRREVGLARRLLERLQLGGAHQRPLGRRRRHLLRRRDEVSGEYEQERPPLDHGAVVDDLREERRVDGEAGGEASKEEGVGPCELDRGEEPDRAASARKPRRIYAGRVAVTGEKPPGLRRAAFCAICGSSAHVLSAVAADWPSAVASGGAALSAQVAAAR